MRICKQCGIEFVGGPRAWYCPKCREERRREQDRQFKEKKRKYGADRPLGSIDRCVVCGKEYIVQSARQKYCKNCAPTQYKEVDRQQGRGWLKKAIERYGEEYKKKHLARKRENRRKHKAETFCPMCGIKTFGQKFCCEQCRHASERYSYAKYSYNVGRRKSEPKLEDYQKGGRLYERN